MGWTRKTSQAQRTFRNQTRFQHWYRDNQVYFLTARCRDQFPAFASPPAKQIFWKQFNQCIQTYSFTPWVTSLLDNHYHTIGYLKQGEELPRMMHRLHGSVAKLVNDLLQSQPKPGVINHPRHPRPNHPHPNALTNGRLIPFWRDTKHKNYFDGCLRDEKQGQRTYQYVLTQSVRHGICADWHDYPDTHVNIEPQRAIKRAVELGAFLKGVPYKRYAQGGGD